MPNPFVHIELNTGDLAKAKKFYKAVFGWKLSDSKSVPYTMIEADMAAAGAGGGMQAQLMPGAPTMWLPYVGVKSVVKTVAAAKKAGAHVLLEHLEIGEMGAIGVFVDPTGASIGVWEEAGGAAPPKAKAAPKKKTAPAKKAAPKAAPKKAAAPAKKPVAAKRKR